MPATAKLARVLFDEAHSEAWTIRDEVARELQPAHPADSSYAAAARALGERDFEVAVNADRKLTSELLRDVDVLVIAHPSDPKWEATVPSGPPLLDPAEIEAVDAFVRAGGGLVVLGETEQDKYGNNLNELLVRFGIDRSKLAQWIAAHDLVSEYVLPAEGSRWARASRDLPEVDEPKQLVDLVKDDEFPLSLFYSQLEPKLDDVLTRPRDAIASAA